MRERTKHPDKTWTPWVCKSKSKLGDNKTIIQHTKQRQRKTLIRRSNNINISKTKNCMHMLVPSKSLPILEQNLPGLPFCTNNHPV